MNDRNGVARSRKSVRTQKNEELVPELLSHEAASMIAYIADMSAELASMAGNCNQPMLVYFLNLARVEAELKGRKLMDYEKIERS